MFQIIGKGSQDPAGELQRLDIHKKKNIQTHSTTSTGIWQSKFRPQHHQNKLFHSNSPIKTATEVNNPTSQIANDKANLDNLAQRLNKLGSFSLLKKKNRKKDSTTQLVSMSLVISCKLCLGGPDHQTTLKAQHFCHIHKYDSQIPIWWQILNKYFRIQIGKSSIWISL